MVKNKKGDRRERELVNKLSKDGFAVLRSPASGSRTDRDLPDIFAGNPPLIYAIEVKSSEGAPIYITEEKIDGLYFFAQSFNAKPRVAVRFDYEDWFFFSPESLYRTAGDNYRVKKETATSDGITYTSLINQQ